MVTRNAAAVQPSPALPWGVAWVCAFALLLARMAYVTWLSPYGLGPDEAQYWHWTRHLDWSYLTKPPLTTTMIWLSTSVFDETLVGVKFWALVGQSAVVLLGFGLAGAMAGVGAAWLAFGLLATVPIVTVGGLLMSPDALLLPLWMLALYLIISEFKNNNLTWNVWVWVGVVVGVAGLAKYNAALFYPLLLGWALLEKRSWLKQPQPYVAGGISLLMQAPVLIWNMQNGWAGVHHVLWQADGGGDGRHGGWATLLEFLGGQALVLGPVVFAVMVGVWGGAVVRYRRLPPAMRLLLVFTLPMFLVFTVQTLNAKVQPNWPLLATVPALVMVAVSVAPYVRLRGVVIAGLVLNVVFSTVLHDTFMLRAAGLDTRYKIDPTKDMRGWPEMGALIGLQTARLDNPLILTTRYQTAAQVAFHTPQRPETLYMNDGTRRANQYDLWSWPSLEGRMVLYVNEQNNLPAVVKNRFGQCEPWQPLQVEQRGIITRQLYTWLCWTSILS